MGGTPASWELATPVYGIRYPKPTAPAVYLPDMFQHTGLDVEAALQAAQIPPTVPAAVIVAASSAARDSYWGIPGTDPDRLTLQNRGATTIRTDLGYSERFYAAYSASNQGGRTEGPGWYPVDGTAMRRYLIPPTSFTMPPGSGGGAVITDTTIVAVPVARRIRLAATGGAYGPAGQAGDFGTNVTTTAGTLTNGGDWRTTGTTSASGFVPHSRVALLALPASTAARVIMTTAQSLGAGWNLTFEMEVVG